MAFTAKMLSWRFRHLNIVGCLLKRRPTKGGSRAPQDLPLATPLQSNLSAVLLTHPTLRCSPLHEYQTKGLGYERP